MLLLTPPEITNMLHFLPLSFEDIFSSNLEHGLEIRFSTKLYYIFLISSKSVSDGFYLMLAD